MMTLSNHRAASVVPESASAGWFLEGLAAQDSAFEALLGRHPRLRLAVGRDALAWAHGDGLVLRGLVSLPVVLGPDRHQG